MGDTNENAGAFRFVDAGEGVVLALKCDAITLRSSVPSPPGSRRDADLLASGLRFKIKVHASRKQPDASYVLEGRLFDATKAVIEALTKATQATQATA
jgi:hypothetical protein